MALLAPRIDHVVINVGGELDAAVERYRRLGFMLTPRGHHTLGSSNNLAIFGDDYLELLGFEPGRGSMRPDLLLTPPGLSGLVFKPPANPAFAEALRAAGVPAEEPREFSRPVELPGGAKDARFRVVNLIGAVPDARVFFCHHGTPELVWRPEWQQHPNGVTGIKAFTMAAADPAVRAEPFRRLFGPDAFRRDGDGLVLTTDKAEVRFLPHAALGIPPGKDRMVGLEFFAAVDVARAALREGGVSVDEDGGTLHVPAAQACGVALAFTK